ncbi:MAG: type II toxin-antitoxin system RelE/ParE family toxin [Nitrospinae bacterium]|nr:type II toxin-antitoxin system RelE/ParE family toxin [Nitrospinota bacterium]
MAELIWSGKALSDIEDIYDYIAHDSPHYARQQAEQILNSANRLRQFPESGHHLPEFPHLPHRELLIGNYRVIYRYASNHNRAIIITVVHAARLLKQPPETK